MGGTPALFDMSKAQPIQASSAPLFDMSKAQPIDSSAGANTTPASPRGFLSTLASQPSTFSHANPLRYFDELGQGMAKGVDALAHPIDTAKQTYDFLAAGLKPQGPSPDMSLGDVADTVAQNWGQVATGAAAGKALGEVPRGSISAAVRGTGKVLDHPYVAPALGAAADVATGGHGVTGAVAGHMVRGGLKNLLGRMQTVGLEDPALAQSQPLADAYTPAAQPASQTGEALGQIPQRGASSVQPAEAQQIKRGSLSQMLSQQLEKGLDAGPPLKGNVSLRGQLSSTMQGGSDMPAGHTPVQSSALTSYKYDPAANEFHSKYSSGGDTVHVFGDVSPEEAQAFEQAKSKGQAMQTIKNGHPLVAKIVNGKRVDVTPARGATSQPMSK